MSNVIEQAKTAIVDAMAYRFPQYPVRFEDIEDDSRILGVGVFAVPVEEFMAVQDYVFDLESSGMLPDGWELLPLVRDPATTSKHYPHILAKWLVPLRYDLGSQVIPSTAHSLRLDAVVLSIKDIMRSVSKSAPAWECEPAGCACAHEPAQPRSDLALAA